MFSKKCAVRIATLSLLLLALVLWVGCSSSGTGIENAAPTFCPTRYASTLPTPLAAENVPPQAYYQNVLTVQDQPVAIILYACDPDNPATSEGLTWRADLGPCEGPCNGQLSIDLGAYPDDGVITYTPRTGYLGTDSIQYVVDDGLGEGNIATIEITVNPPQSTATSLYFGGWDDGGTLNLWSYNSGSGLMTVPNSASVLASRGTYYFMDQVVFNGDLFQMGNLGDGGAALYKYNSSSGFGTFSSGFPFDGSNFATLDNTLYMGFSNIAGFNGYLWATDGVSPVATVPGTAGIDILNIAAFGGSLFFDGDDTVSKQLWVRSGNGTVGTLSSVSAGAAFPYGLDPDSFTSFDGNLYFMGNTAPTGRTLWQLNGSGPISTVGNLQVSYMNESPRMVAFLNNWIFINGSPPTGGPSQLYAYNVSSGFRTLTSNSTYDVDPRYMTNFNGQLVFAGGDDTGQIHLMFTDAANVYTVPGTAGMDPRLLTVYDDKLFFSAGNYPDIQLWYTTSTISSPTQVSFISTANGEGLNPSGLIVY